MSKSKQNISPLHRFPFLHSSLNENGKPLISTNETFDDVKIRTMKPNDLSVQAFYYLEGKKDVESLEITQIYILDADGSTLVSLPAQRPSRSEEEHLYLSETLREKLRNVTDAILRKGRYLVIISFESERQKIAEQWEMAWTTNVISVLNIPSIQQLNEWIAMPI